MPDHSIRADGIARLFAEGLISIKVGLGTIIDAHQWRGGLVSVLWQDGRPMTTYPPEFTFKDTEEVSR